MANILVIADNECTRDSFVLSLKASNIVETASTACEGVDKAKNSKPDIIFLDLLTPYTSGIEVLPTLLKICPGVKVYIVTSFIEEYMRELKIAKNKGLEFEICKKSLTNKQIQLIVESASVAV